MGPWGHATHQRFLPSVLLHTGAMGAAVHDLKQHGYIMLTNEQRRSSSTSTIFDKDMQYLQFAGNFQKSNCVANEAGGLCIILGRPALAGDSTIKLR